MLTYSCPVPELWEGQACGPYPQTGKPSNLCCGGDATPGDTSTYSYSKCDMSSGSQVCSPDLRSCSEKYTNRAICADGLDSNQKACIDCVFKGCNSNFYNVFPLDAKGDPVVPLDRSPHETCQIITDFTSVGNLIGHWTNPGIFSKNTPADITVNCCHTGEDKYNSAAIACADLANDPRVINSSTSKVGLWETTRCSPGMRIKIGANNLNIGAFSAQPEAKWNSPNTESSLWNYIKDRFGNDRNLDAHWNNPNFTLTRAAGCGDGNCE